MKNFLIGFMMVFLGLIVTSGTQAETILLIQSNTTDADTNFIDSSGYHHIIDVGAPAQHDTDIAKFGTTSMFFDGTSSYLKIPASLKMQVGTGDFTMEFWVNPAELDSLNIFAGYGNYTVEPIFFIRHSNFMTVPANSTSPDNIIPLSIPKDTWTHIAIVRAVNIITVYINGVSQGTCTSYHDFSTSHGINVGSFTYPSGSGSAYYNFYGHIDEFSFSDAAVYRGDFTPPTAPYEFPAEYGGGEGNNPNDSDNDGITNDIDMCPNTPDGTIVDINGCPVNASQTLKFKYNADVMPQSDGWNIINYPAYESGHVFLDPPGILHMNDPDTWGGSAAHYYKNFGKLNSSSGIAIEWDIKTVYSKTSAFFGIDDGVNWAGFFILENGIINQFGHDNSVHATTVDTFRTLRAELNSGHFILYLDGTYLMEGIADVSRSPGLARAHFGLGSSAGTAELFIDEIRGYEITSSGTAPAPSDSDNDGIIDDWDACPYTPEGSTVDSNGCAVDCLTQVDVDQAVANAVYEKDRIISDLQLTVANLEASLAQKDQVIASANSQIDTLNADITQRDQQIAILNSQVIAKDHIISDLNVQIASMYTQEKLDQAVAAAVAAAIEDITSGMTIPGGVPGSIPAEQLQNLTNAINSSPACENTIEKYFRKN